MIQGFHTSELAITYNDTPHTITVRGCAYSKGKVSLVVESDPPIDDVAAFLAMMFADYAARQKAGA